MADGKITIDTRLNNAGFKAGSKELLTAIKSLERTAAATGKSMQSSAAGYGSAMRNSIRATREFNAELRQLERETTQMRKDLDFRGNSTGAKQFMEITDKVRQYEKALQTAQERSQAMADKMGEKALNSKAFWESEKEIERLQHMLENLHKERDALGVSDSDVLDFSNQSRTLSEMEDRLRNMRSVSDEAGGGFRILMRNAGNAAMSIAGIAGHGVLSFLEKLASGAKNVAIQLAKLAGRAIRTGLQKIGELAGGAAKRLFGLGKAAKRSGNGFQFSLKNLLRYGLGIRSLFVLFNRLRNAIKEGFGELSKQDPRVRASLASLKAALGGLKGSLASAFSPILTAIAPALTVLINMLTSAVNAIGMFMAAITGQSYYAVAKGIGAIGSSAGGASGSVKELKRQLAGFDELNILTANSGGGGGGGGGGSGVGYNYEQMPIAEAIADFANQMKALIAAEDWDGLGHLLADKVNGAFIKAQSLISWDNLGAKISGVVDAVTGTINGLVDGIDWPNIGATFGEGLNTITNTLLRWYRGIKWEDIGTGIGRAINGFFDRVDWPNIGNLVREKAGSIVSILKGALTTIEWGDAGTKLGNALNTFFKDDKIWHDAGIAINAALNGPLDFVGKLLEKFDPIQAADDIKALIGEIKWGQIADKFWADAKLAFGSFTTFIKELFKEDNPAEKYFRQRPAGLSNQSETFGSLMSDLAETILGAIKKAIKQIPWEDIGDGINKTLKDIEWGPILSSLWDSLVELAKGLGKTVISAIFGKDSDITKMLFPVLDNPKLSGETVQSALLGIPRLNFVGDYIKSLLGIDTPQATTPQATKNGSLPGGHKVTDEELIATGMMLKDKGYSFEEIQKTLNLTAEQLKEVEYNTRGIGPFGKFGDWLTGTNRDQTGTKDYQKAYARATGSPMVKLADSLDETKETVTSKISNTAKEVAKALNANTKTTKEQTKAESDTTEQKRFEWLMGGGDLAGWDSLFSGDGSVDVGVNFLPQGTGGQSFINNMGGYLKKVFAPGTDTVVRTDYVKADPDDTPEKQFGDKLTVSATLQRLGATVAELYGTKLTVGSTLQRLGNTIAELYGTKLTIQATLIKKPGNKLTYSIGSVANGSKVVVQAMGGIITAGGRALRFASGGAISSSHASWWPSVQKYASGTRNAHGTMFVAGEAGPEIVGHIGGRTEVLNRSQLAQTMYNAVTAGMIAALRGLTFTVPNMATGNIMPYEVSAQIAKSTADIQGTLDANNEDLIQTIISVIGAQTTALVSALQNLSRNNGSGSANIQQIINEINRRSQMYSESPIKGV